jgi:tripartite-type tricarboxylate transporter receptor subunit TctC
MKFKVIPGYLTSPDRLLAQERGELTGNCGYNTSTVLATLYEPYKSGKIRFLFQAATRKDPRFPDVPNIRDEAKTPEARAALDYMFATLELGRPYAAPAETPPDRVALLRAAFDRAVADPALVEEAKRLQIDLETMTGAQSAASVERLYATPRAVVERVRAAVGGNP